MSARNNSDRFVEEGRQSTAPLLPRDRVLLLCPICCSEDLSISSGSSITLSTCGHASCKSCLVKWVEREESSGQTMSPTCPFCRAVISDTDVLAILARPFQPREALAKDSNAEEEIDELTMQWLIEHTKVCQGCGTRVEKSFGCDHMECLCGYRFCYNCGSPGGICTCGNSRTFINNPLRSVPDDLIRDINGQVDLRSTLMQRKVRRECEQQRRRAYAEVIPDHIEKYDYLDMIVWYVWAGVV